MFAKADQKPEAIAIILGGLLLFMAGGATALLLGPENRKPGRDSVINPDAFADGIGIYLFNDNKYNLLVWKKKIVAAPGTAPDPKDIAEASREAIAVGSGVRFFTYGLDVATWPVVPPYDMAFCIVPCGRGKMRSSRRSLKHDLFGKPVSTFPDHVRGQAFFRIMP
jgi:hypothetical protein